MYNLIIVFSTLSGLFGLFLYKRLEEAEQKFVHYIWLGLLFEFIAKLSTDFFEELSALGFENTLPGLHLYTLLQFVFVMAFFKAIFSNLEMVKYYAVALFVGCCFIICNSIFLQSIFEINSYSKAFVEFVIIIFSIYYFYWVMNSDQIVKINQAIDLFVAAVFLNAAFSILIHLFGNQMWNLNIELLGILWDIRAAINNLTLLIILYGLFTLYKLDPKIEIQKQMSK